MLTRAVVLASAFGAAAADSMNPRERFEEFKKRFKLHFETKEEDDKRFAIFVENLGRAEKLSQKSKTKADFGVTVLTNMLRFTSSFYLSATTERWACWAFEDGTAGDPRKRRPFTNISSHRNFPT